MPKLKKVSDVGSVWDAPAVGAGGSVVEPPTPTSESRPAGTPLGAKTFLAFSDVGSVIASYSAVNTVAEGSASWSGSGLGAYTPTSADGDRGTLSLNALNASGDIVATAVHSYNRGAPTSGASWETVENLQGSSMVALAASGPGTYTFDWGGGKTMDCVVSRQSGSTGTVEGVVGVGPKIDPGTASDITVAAFDLMDVLPLWAIEYAKTAAVAVHIQCDLTFSAFNDNGAMIGFNTTTTMNSVDFRGMRVRWKNGGNPTQLRSRVNTAETQYATEVQAATRQFVLTLIISGGNIIDFKDTPGTTIPTPTPGTGTQSAGGDGVSVPTSSIDYTSLYLILCAVYDCVFQVGDIKVQRWQ